jgi:hypothetical protein
MLWRKVFDRQRREEVYTYEAVTELAAERDVTGRGGGFRSQGLSRAKKHTHTGNLFIMRFVILSGTCTVHLPFLF